MSRNKTIRFDNMNAAKSFAKLVGGQFKECHSQEASRYKVQFKTDGNYKGTRKKDNSEPFIDHHAHFHNLD